MSQIRHGVYVNEEATQARRPREVTTGIQFVVGTAPVHLLPDPSAAVNEPILVRSLTEAKQKLGYSEDFDSFTLCQSMYMTLSVLSIAPIIFVNVLDPGNNAHKTVLAESTLAVNNGVAKLTQQGVLLAELVVKDSEDSTLVAGEDYIASHDGDGNVLITILASGIESIKVSGSALNPASVTTADIIGGVDPLTGAETGLQLIRKVYPKYGINAATIIAPGYSQEPSVAAVMASLCEEINGVFRAETVIDIDSSTYTKYTDADAMKAAIGVKSPHAYLVWPKVKIGQKTIFASANAAAVAQYTDYSNGGLPNISPSNESAYIDAAVLANGTEVLLDSEQGNVLNGSGIATYVRSGGTYRLWGNYSAAYPDNNDPKDKWWCIRRFFSWHANNFIRTYFDEVDDPTNRRLIEGIVDAENIVMNGYVANGACAGARIEVSDQNTSETLMDGKLYFVQKITPFPPAQEIVNTLSFDPDALTAALQI